MYVWVQWWTTFIFALIAVVAILTAWKLSRLSDQDWGRLKRKNQTPKKRIIIEEQTK